MAFRYFWSSVLSVAVGFFVITVLVDREGLSLSRSVLVTLLFWTLSIAPMFAYRAGFIKGVLLEKSWILQDYELVERAELSYARRGQKLTEKATALNKVGRTKVYVVTTGSYSAYGIDRLFASRELAEEWMNKDIDFKRDYNDVEEFVVLEAVPEMRRILTMHSYWVDALYGAKRWFITGETLGWSLDEEWFSWSIPDDGVSISSAEVRIMDPGPEDRYVVENGRRVDIYVEGVDHDKVRKVFYDTKAQKAAELEGLV